MYDKQNLPPLKSDSDGHLRPAPDKPAAVVFSPIAVDDLPYPENWGMGEDAVMNVPKGGAVTCIGPRDTYLNAEFSETSSLTPGKVLDPETDERAAELVEFFTGRHGVPVLVYEGRKTVGLKVFGEISDEAVGENMNTREGVQKLSAGDVIVECPRSGDVWRITPGNRAKRYAEDGRIFEGELPAEYR